MRGQPGLHLQVAAAVATGIARHPGFMSRKLVLPDAGGFPTGLLDGGGADIRRVQLAAVGAEFLGGNGAFHEVLLHETITERSCIVMAETKEGVAAETACTFISVVNCTLLNRR